MAVQVEGRKVRYAVVGAGWISQAAFMPGVAHTGNSELTAIVTGDHRKAEALGRRYGITRTYHYDAYLAALDSAGFDALYIAVPNGQHRDYAIPALDRGLHVLLEKPMAVTEEDCRAITAAARQGGAKLMIGYRLHFEPATLEAVRLVQSNALGRVRLFSSTFTQHVAFENHRAQNGFWAGPVADMGPYPINAARHLFGAEPVEVMAWGARTQGFGFHDTVSVLLRFPEERLAQFTVAYGLNAVDTYRVVGTEGDLQVSPGFGFDARLRHRLTVGESTIETAFPEVDQFGGETAYFSACILQDLEPEPDGEEGRLDVRVVAAVGRALETGQSQALAPVQRTKRPHPDQARNLLPVKSPPLFHAAAPGG
ncbi:MAG: Gfo/Idh/MocA family oxidoreductase [Acetobacteraceae bacterium]|nr:Gfo/Idh/MocA family oxidoreductase [Acetobacteraceae bacterium]